MIQILHEDDSIVVLQKPPCVHSVMKEGGGEESVAAFLAERIPETREASRKPEDSGLVQRLDFETSGLLVAAKSRVAWEKLFQALAQGEMQKTYLAIIDGAFHGKEIVRGHIGSPYRRGKKVHVYTDYVPKNARALPAETIYKSLMIEDAHTLVEVEASPARRHQVRAHAAFMGHPLQGDELYGSKNTLSREDYAAPFFLCAQTLQFMHPGSGAWTSWSAKLPAFAAALSPHCRSLA